MSLHVIFLLLLAFLTFVVAPIWLIYAIVAGMRQRASDRPSGGGGISNMVGAAMLEVDRLFTRPSIEHTIETEQPVLKREDDAGGE
jgi:hypothetical protein